MTLRQAPVPGGSTMTNTTIVSQRARRGLSVAQRLTLIVLVVALPMLLLSAGIIWRLGERERDAQRDAIMYAARSILGGVDAQLGKYIAIAQSLAASPSVKADNLAAFTEEAMRVLPGLPNAWVALADADGRQLVNTFVPRKTALPRMSPQAVASQGATFATGTFGITDVAVGSVAKIPLVSVVVPVFRDDLPFRTIYLAIDVAAFRDLLNGQRMPEGWLAAIVDGSGNFIARSLDHDHQVGKPASAAWLPYLKREGWFDTRSVEGEPYTSANAVSPLSGWTLGVAASKDVLDASGRQTLMVAGLIGLAVTLLSILLATRVARQITGPIGAMETGARALRHHLPVGSAPTGMLEIDVALEAFDSASRELRAHEKRRAESEAALKASEERRRLLVEQAPASIAMFDRDMRYLAVSQRWIAQFCPQESDLIGRLHDEVIPDIPERWKERHRRSLEGEVLAENDDRFERADGGVLWISWEMRPWRGPDGAIGGVVIFADDVTARHQAISALKESEERYARLANATKEGVVICDGGRIVEANAGFGRMIGCDPGAAVGRSLADFLAADGRNDASAQLERSAGEPFETVGLRRDGETFPVEVSGSAITYNGRDMRVALMRDLTTEKRAEEDRRALQAELMRASRLSEIGRMAAALAHELNQPLTAVTSYIGGCRHELNQPLTAVTSYIGGCRRLLRGDTPNAETSQRVRDVMDLANAQALRAGEVIRRTREFFGTGQTKRTVEDAATVMREASTLAIAAAKHNGIAIRADIGPAGLVLVDKVQIQQVIVNLVRNGIEAMEDSPRKELAIALKPHPDSIELSVADTGGGISPDMAGRLFKPFSSTKSQGMGIGLSVCREIVEAHDGKIWAEPRPGGGAVFSFTLPLVSEDAARAV
jgi:PAS domain S-box-containing protein